jgi:hypothetical protein
VTTKAAATRGQQLLDWALARLSENSTWRGITLLATSAGVAVDPVRAKAIVAVGLGIVGLINVLRREAK